MAERSKEFEHSLLQRDPAREARDRQAMLSKMRGKLANFAPPAAAPQPRRFARDRGAFRKWVLRGVMVLLVAAINWLVLERKETLMVAVGIKGVPSLPAPRNGLNADEKALYYAYALYDFGKFKQRYRLEGDYAIDQASARQRLQEILPRISTATLGEISKYAPVGYLSVTAGGRNP